MILVACSFARARRRWSQELQGRFPITDHLEEGSLAHSDNRLDRSTPRERKIAHPIGGDSNHEESAARPNPTEKTPKLT